MKRYDIYYETAGGIIERKNVSQEEMQSFLNSLKEKDEHLLRIHQNRENFVKSLKVYKECKVEYTDDLKTDVEVKAKTLKSIEEYIDR